MVDGTMETPSVPAFRERVGWWLGGAAIVLGALAIRAWDLGRESYWLDELCSLSTVRGGWRYLVDELARSDVHPPLYFALLKLWTRVFGTTEAAGRSLSVVAGLAAVVSAGRLGRELADRRVGLVAMALVACSPFCVYYSTEARAYSLLLALSLEATVRLVRAARDPRAGSLAAYALVAATLPYTHVFGTFTLAAHGLTVVGAAYAGRLGRRPALGVIGAIALAALAFAPWVPVQLGQMHRVRQGFWLGDPQVGWWFTSWVRGGDAGLVWVVGVLAAAALTVRRWWRERRAGAGLLAAGMLVPTVVPLAITYLAQPVFQPKYAIAAAGALLVAAAPTLARNLPAALILCLAGALDSGRDLYVNQHRADWRALAGFARREAARDGTPLVMRRGLNRQLAVYLGRHVEVRDVEPGREVQLPRRFWLLNVHPEWTDPRLAPLLAAHWKPVERRAFYRAEAILWEAERDAGDEVAMEAPKPPSAEPAPDAGVVVREPERCRTAPLRL